jgi:hypothetical protein
MWKNNCVLQSFDFSHLDKSKGQIICILRHKNSALFLRQSLPWNYQFVLFFSWYSSLFSPLPRFYFLTKHELRRRLDVLFPTLLLLNVLALPILFCCTYKVVLYSLVDPNIKCAFVENLKSVIDNATSTQAKGHVFLILA